jgi:hypothetical protein
MAERRPTLTASARAGVRNLRSGRKKAYGAVEQKKAAKQGRKKSGKKALAFVAAIRERKNARFTAPPPAPENPTPVDFLAITVLATKAGLAAAKARR